MLRRSWLFVFLFIGLAFTSPAQQVDASTTGGPTSLDAPWRIHFGDDPGYAQPNFDDSKWTLHRIDQDWASAGHKGYSGYAWYRMRVVLPKSSEPLAIGIYPPVNAAVEVYIDGALAGTIGRMRPRPVWTFVRDVYAVPVPAALHGHPVEIALRVWLPSQTAPYAGEGAAAHPALLGTAGDVERIAGAAQQNQWVAKIPDWGVDLLGLAVGLFSFGLFLLQRHAREYAYAAIFFCGSAASNLYYWICQQTDANLFVGVLVMNLAGAVMLCLWLFFTWEFMRARADRLLYACLAVTWIGQINTPLAFLGVISEAAYFGAGAALFLFLAIAVFVRLYPLARRGNRDAQLFLIPFSFWALANCFRVILWVLGTAGIVWSSAWTLYHGSRFDITWGNVLGLLLNLSVGAVLVLRYGRTAKQEQLLRGELEAARTVQQILVPEEIPTIPGFSIQAVYHPAGQVGGDFYQVLPTPGGSLLAIIGDVSGKGMPAAMTVSLLVGTVRTLAHYTQDPAAILTAMNQRMIGRGSGFTTCLVLRLDPDGTLTAANAGHIAPYANGKELSIDNGLPLGITAAAEYTNTTLHLAPNTTLTLLTDGVVEAQNEKGELFGFDRAAAISSKPAQTVADAAQAFGQEDDITVLTLGFASAEVSRA